MNYFWTIKALDGQPADELVPITLHSSGNFHTMYGMLPSVTGVYNLAPNYLTLGIAASFNTWAAYNPITGSSIDQRSLGLTMGGLNWGTDRVEVPSGGQTQYEYKVMVDASFDQSFNLMARPGYENSITMQAGGFLYTNWPNYPASYATELWSFHAYIDPIITIDPAFADRYVLQVSDIPYVAQVPEPATGWLLSAAFGLLALQWRRSKAAS